MLYLSAAAPPAGRQLKEAVTMDRDGCSCEGENTGTSCPRCGSELSLLYWCETCEQPAAGKRCPVCGLKTHKVPEPIRVGRDG